MNAVSILKFWFDNTAIKVIIITKVLSGNHLHQNQGER